LLGEKFLSKVIYLVRHGNTLSNQRKIYAGLSNEGLTSEGVMQADMLGSKIINWNIDAVYTSPIRRAVQTAEILNQYVPKPLIVEPHLAEMRMGAWEGLSEEEIAYLYPNELQLWLSKPSELRLEGREILADIQKRAVGALEKILDAHFYETILIVTHIAVIRCLIIHFQNLSLDTYKK
jgi:alpha-ribazole phosphatase/probable phosphoglycerate mutase